MTWFSPVDRTRRHSLAPRVEALPGRPIVQEALAQMPRPPLSKRSIVQQPVAQMALRLEVTSGTEEP